jgi:hypothetical protein
LFHVLFGDPSHVLAGASFDTGALLQAELEQFTGSRLQR